ncbi:MAG: OmpW family outer membrane protein [Thermoanaerobaculia bacterium]
MRWLCSIALLFLALPLLAQSNELTLLGGKARVSKTEVDGSEVRFDSGNAYGISYNRFWGSWFSTDFTAMKTRNDARIRFGGEDILDAGTLNLRLLAAIAQFHCLHEGALDAYAGAGVVNVNADDLNSADLATAGVTGVRVKSRTTWLADVGAAIGIGHSFAVGVDGKYVRYRPDSAEAGGEAVRLKIDPVIVSLALKFRF